MTVNPNGYISPIDGGNPRIVTGIAFEDMSGGQMVFASGAADVVNSGLASFVASDIGLALGASGAKFNGVILQDVTSGNYVGVVTRGIVIVSAGAACTNGQPAMAGGGDGVANLASVSGSDVPVMVTDAVNSKVGRFWSSTGTSGNFVLMELTP